MAENEDKENKISLRRLRLNWLLTLLLGVNFTVGYSMALSTLHKFMTNPRNETCGSPGLGESETMYAIASGIYSGGDIAGSLTASILLNVLSYRFLLAIGPIVQILGCTLYGLSINGWMVIAGRFLIGINTGLTMSSIMSYYTVSSCIHGEQAFKKNSGLKKRLMIVYGIVVTLSYLPSNALVVLVFKFPDVNQFRWFSWFQIAFGIATLILLICLFKNHKIDHPVGHKFNCTRKNKEVGISSKSDEKLNHVNWTCWTALVVVYLLLAAYIIDSEVTVLDTLTSPLLSNTFGFSSKNISYFLTGSLAIVPTANFILLLLERFRVSSRVVLLLSLLIGTSGLITLGDWQSISDTSCSNISNVSIQSNINSCSITSSCVNSTFNPNTTIYFYKIDTSFDYSSSCTSCDTDCLALQLSEGSPCTITETLLLMKQQMKKNQCMIQNITYALCHLLPETFESIFNQSDRTVTTELIIDDNNVISSNQQICESYEDCYWNQDSYITGDYCVDCLPICKSKSKSLSFIQACIGVGSVTLSLSMGRYILFPIMTKVSPPQSQAVTTSLVVFVQALSRLITPLWANSLYIASGHHTFLLMGVMLLCQLPVYIGYCLFCSHLSFKKVNAHRPSFSSVVPLVSITAIDDDNINNEIEQNQVSTDIEDFTKHETAIDSFTIEHQCFQINVLEENILSDTFKSNCLEDNIIYETPI